MDFTDVDSIISENNIRLAEISREYDALVGQEYCQEIRRTRIDIPDAPIPTMYIPVEMEDEIVVKSIRIRGTLADTGRGVFGGAASDKKSIEVWRQFEKVRVRYDFEYWCVRQVTIEHKITLADVPFSLNRAQRHLLRVLEGLRKANSPIFVILLKARQWGGSTMIQFYMLWLQLFWREHWNSIIAADVDDHALNVQAMIMKAIENFDTFITDGKHIEFTPFNGMDSTRVIKHRGCRVSIGSVQHPNSIRSHNITMAHLTEVGVWPTTPKHDPKSLAQSLSGTILRKPYRLKILESTAKGVGNFFHRTWLAAIEGRNEYTPLFIPWFMIDFYSKKIEVPIADFIASLTPYEQMLFKLGATLEAINYYREDIVPQFVDNPQGVFEEYPSTWEEAFQSSGSNFYPYEYVEELRKGVEDPKFIGDIVGDELKGEKALNNVHLVPMSNGLLKVWRDKDKRKKMNNRYIVIVDIGGRSKKADNSVICVMDRFWQKDIDGVPEVAAEWCGHIEHDLLAWKAAQVAHYYDDALLVVESNTLETKGAGGNHFNTLLSEIADVYENVYCRTKNEQLIKGATLHYGFHTNTQTKPMVCDHELAVLRDGLYIEHCAEAVDEHKTFEIKDNGELGAVEGCHDDRHITRAIGNYFCWKIMDRPSFIEEKEIITQDDTEDMDTERINEYTMN